MNKTLSQIQKELEVWTNYNFGQQDSSSPIMGMIEELGELTHTTLKQIQGIRKKDYLEAKKDAVADLVIYLLNYFNSKQVDISKVGNFLYYYKESNEYEHIINIQQCVSKIAFFNDTKSGKYNVPIGNSKRLLSRLYSYCKLNKFDLLDIVNQTWEQVKLRDWRKYPLNGKTE